MTVKVSKPAIHLREELADLKKPTGIAGEAMLRADTPQEQFNLIGAARRNLLINASMTINQRSSAASAAVGNGTTTYYPVDRWRSYGNGGITTVSMQDVVLPNGAYARSLKTLATVDAVTWVHPFQTVEIETWMKGQEVTLSAWVRTTIKGQRMRLCNGATCLLLGDFIPDDGQWHYVVTRTTLPTSTSTAFMQYQPAFNGNALANQYTEFAHPMFELGNVATPFEHRQISEELRLCQRYYSRLFGALHAHPVWLYTTTHWSTTFKTPITMRDTPAISFTGTIVNASGGATDTTKFSVYVAGAWKGLSQLAGGTSNKDYVRIDGTLNDASTAGFAGGLYYGTGCAINLKSELE